MAKYTTSSNIDEPSDLQSSNEPLLNSLPSIDTLTDEWKYTSTSTKDDGNPFSNLEVAQHYRIIYEEAKYECRCFFDPELTWAVDEEKQLVRHIDRRVCLWACIMFFALQMDHGNIVQAVSDNMLQELSMDTNNYNTGNTIFTVTFVCAELPSQLVSKKIGPDRWIPTLITLWSIVGMSQAILSGKKGFYATRALLGLLQGGFVPDIVLWLSYFYTSRELPIRLSLFWSTISATGIITSFLGFGMLHMRGVAGWPGWRWVFLLQGFLTFLIGLGSYFMMPPSIVQTKAWYRPNGWFTDRQTRIAVNRVLRDDPSKGNMHNRQAITPRRLWETLKDYDLWPLYLMGFLADIPPSPPANYLTLILRNLGFSTFNTSLLVIPSAVLHVMTLLAITWLSERFSERTFFASAQNIWTLPCLLALRFWPETMQNAWGTYTLVTILLSYPYSRAIIVGWLSKNSNNVGTRSVSVTIYNILVQAGGIYANNIYVQSDSPVYRNGNTTLIIINSICLALFPVTKVYYILRNKHRDQLWASMSPEERYEYSRFSKATGSKRVDFRFSH